MYTVQTEKNYRTSCNLRAGCWHVIDNKAETYFEKTHYMYSMNNPIRFLDPGGNDVWDVVSIMLGAGESAGGVTIASGSTAVTVGTVGVGMTVAATANLMKQKGRVDESSDKNRKGEGKNAQHRSSKQKDAAKNKYKQAQKYYKALKLKPNKKDKKQLQKLKNLRDSYKRKMDNTGENHSRNAKVNR